MKLVYNKKAEDPFFYIQKTVRNGSKTRSVTVKRLGRYSELAGLYDDPLAYAREELRKCNEEERKRKEANLVGIDREIDLEEEIDSTGTPDNEDEIVNIGYMFPSYVYSQLELGTFFDRISRTRRMEYDCNLINRFLTVSRILNPASKLATVRQLGGYYENPDISYHDCQRFLTVLAGHYDEYIDWLYRKSGNIVQRDTSVCYYDCTNYYFETEYPDEEYVDEVTGEVMPGLRQYGRSKQHQPAPLVQMGLFMDAQGIPINMCLTEGNRNEQLTAITTEKRMIDSFSDKRLIYCADAGLGSIKIRKFNSFGSRAFIVTQSIKKLSQPLQDAVFSDCDYRRLSNGDRVSLETMKSFDRFAEDSLPLYSDIIFKVIPAQRLEDLGFEESYTDESGKTRTRKAKGTMDQYIIVTFSRKTMEYQKAIRDKQVSRAEKMISSGTIERKGKTQNDPRRFIKDDSEKKGNYSIDQNVIDEEAKYDGFYAIATNLDAYKEYERIIGISSQRYKIEECFRILKTDFRARPVYESSRDHIIGHFMTCYTALLVYRLMEARINSGEEHYTTRQIIDNLKRMNVINEDDMYYRATYRSGEISRALNREFPLEINRKRYLPKDLNKKVRKIKK